MVGVGEALKIIRDEKGVTLREISHKTNISTDALRALETDDYRQIPGKFHYLNYLRAYLRALHIEEKGFLEMYKSHIEAIPFKKEEASMAYFTKLKYYRFKKKVTLPYILALLILLLIILYVFLFNPLNISWGDILNTNHSKSSGGTTAIHFEKMNVHHSR